MINIIDKESKKKKIKNAKKFKALYYHIYEVVPLDKFIS